jgi:hypothetical protein
MANTTPDRIEMRSPRATAARIDLHCRLSPTEHAFLLAQASINEESINTVLRRLIHAAIKAKESHS